MQHKRMIFIAAGALVASGLFAGSSAQADSHGGASAAMLANTCAGCHGPNGVSGGPSMPSIAGMPAGYLNEIMAEFKSGDRPSTIMGRLAQGYTDEEVAKISDFYAKQAWGSAAVTDNLKNYTPIDDAMAAKGRKYAKKCGKCHEDNGRSIEDDTPRLAGQWLNYLQIKMDEYKDPDLSVPQPKKMKKQINKLSAEKLDAISHFYASQK